MIRFILALLIVLAPSILSADGIINKKGGSGGGGGGGGSCAGVIDLSVGCALPMMGGVP
jgi:hypothetical protein